MNLCGMAFWNNIRSFFSGNAPAIEQAAAPVAAMEADNALEPATSASPETEQRDYRLTDPGFWRYFNLGAENLAKVPVNHLTVLSNSPWFCALRVISEGIAMLDRQMKEKRDGKIYDVSDHPVMEFFTMPPHPHYSWFDLMCALVVNAMHSNGFALIHRDPRTMRPVYLEHIPRTLVSIDAMSDGSLLYRVSGNLGGKNVNIVIPPSDIIHIKGLTLDGIVGVDTTFVHQDAHAVGLARNQYATATLGNQARPSIAIMSNEALDWKDLQSARKNFMSQYSGTENAGVPLFLSNTDKIEYLQWSPAESAMDKFVNMSVGDVARITKVPLDMLGMPNGGTYGAGVQRSKDLVRFCFGPWVEKIQEEFNNKLFYLDEIGRIYFEFDSSMYIELDAAAQADVLTTYVKTAIMTPNEARARLGLPEIEYANSLLTDINLVPLDKVVEVALAKYLSSKGEQAALGGQSLDSAKNDTGNNTNGESGSAQPAGSDESDDSDAASVGTSKSGKRKGATKHRSNSSD